jgi:alkylation response protein AidB-like acyl-CoA dehydrogenase
MRQDTDQEPKAYWAGLMHALGPDFAERADRCDANDTFVAENFVELKERDVLAAGVPVELGGGGASYPELCEMLRILGRYCGCTRIPWRHWSGAGGVTRRRSNAFCGAWPMSGCNS